jgi:hypothetical protein
VVRNEINEEAVCSSCHSSLVGLPWKERPTPREGEDRVGHNIAVLQKNSLLLKTSQGVMKYGWRGYFRRAFFFVLLDA